MSLLRKLSHLVQEPPPKHVFELSEAGVAYSVHGRQGFEAFPVGTLLASPVEDNLLSVDAISSAIRQAAGGNGKKRRPAAVILPDYAVRVSLLDFDSFPAAPEEQLALVRFRIKKTIPFDIESAAVSYWIQPSPHEKKGDKKKADVIAVTVAYEILARYEALFRSAGFLPGEVTPSSLAALELHRQPGAGVIVRLAGHIVTVIAVVGGRIRLFRCLALDDVTDEELLGVLQPTFAYVEDELGEPVTKLWTCGFARPPEGIGIPVEPLRSTLGEVNGFNAGLLGYLESVN